jgi:type IV pilus assembly protein PilC
MERAESLRKQVKSAMIYPIMVVIVAVLILVFIMLKIVPQFETMFDEFDFELPAMTILLMTISKKVVRYWYLIPMIPLGIVLSVLVLRKFKYGRAGWDQFILKIPIFGKLVEKNIMARTVRTLGTLIASGVPILEGLTITRETSSNSVFENLYGKVSESIREGETIAAPLKKHSRPGFHPVALVLWMLLAGGPVLGGLLIAQMVVDGWYIALACAALGALFYVMKLKDRVVDPLVVNMVDVGEETGELDTMLYKVADVFDEEVKVLTDGLMKLIEPLLMIFLGGAVGFIVIALFLPLIELIKNLS